MQGTCGPQDGVYRPDNVVPQKPPERTSPLGQSPHATQFVRIAETKQRQNKHVTRTEPYVGQTRK